MELLDWLIGSGVEEPGAGFNPAINPELGGSRARRVALASLAPVPPFPWSLVLAAGVAGVGLAYWFSR